MTPEEQMILHHHALALEYLLERLEKHGENTSLLRMQAFCYALGSWDAMEPGELAAALGCNIATIRALSTAMPQNHDRPKHPPDEN